MKQELSSAREPSPSASGRNDGAWSPTSEQFANMAAGFRLGTLWPDWWADAVSDNHAMTFNDDGRWRGGPDRAVLWTPEGLLTASHGDWIVLTHDGRFGVLKAPNTSPTVSESTEGGESNVPNPNPSGHPL